MCPSCESKDPRKTRIQNELIKPLASIQILFNTLIVQSTNNYSSKQFVLFFFFMLSKCFDVQWWQVIANQYRNGTQTGPLSRARSQPGIGYGGVVPAKLLLFIRNLDKNLTGISHASIALG